MANDLELLTAAMAREAAHHHHCSAAATRQIRDLVDRARAGARLHSKLTIA